MIGSGASRAKIVALLIQKFITVLFSQVDHTLCRSSILSSELEFHTIRNYARDTSWASKINLTKNSL